MITQASDQHVTNAVGTKATMHTCHQSRISDLPNLHDYSAHSLTQIRWMGGTSAKYFIGLVGVQSGGLAEIEIVALSYWWEGSRNEPIRGGGHMVMGCVI